MQKQSVIGETSGFQSQAQDYLENAIDLADTLDLKRPNIYPVRVKGDTLAARGVRDGDVLIVDTARPVSAGDMAVLFVNDAVTLGVVDRVAGDWLAWCGGRAVRVSESVDIWGVATALVRQKL